MTKSKRKVIIHKHLFKNAGSTLDWSLKNNFGNNFCDHRDDLPMRKYGESYLYKYLEEHNEIKALSSHHVWFHFSTHPSIELIPVYFLRHPIERIRSVYNFEKIQQSDSLGAKMAKLMKFKEYVAWRMKHDVPDTIRNFQTRVCSGIKKGNPINLQHYNAAKEELEKARFVGIVDEYEKSVSMFEHEFNKMGISLDLSFTPQNVQQGITSVDYNKRAKSILSELGEPLAMEVVEKNQFDIDLYHFAKHMLKKL